MITWFVLLRDGLGASASKDNQIEKRIGAETVGSVYGRAGSLTGSKKARHDNILTIFIGDHLIIEKIAHSWILFCLMHHVIHFKHSF